MSGTDPNWIRDRTGYDINRFLWATPSPIVNGPDGRTSFVTLTLNGDVNDWNPVTNQVSFQESSVVRLNPTQNVNISGMVSAIGGELKTFVNIGNFFVTCLNQSGLSNALNQFDIGADVIIAPGNAAQFWYDPVAQNWALVSPRGGVLGAMPLMMSGGGVAIPTGIAGWLESPCQATIIGWKLMSTEQSTITVDIWKTAFAGFPPTGANSITAGNPPKLTNQKANSDTALAGWTTSLVAGDIVMFNINATNGNAIRAMISLDVIRSQ